MTAYLARQASTMILKDNQGAKSADLLEPLRKELELASASVKIGYL